MAFFRAHHAACVNLGLRDADEREECRKRVMREETGKEHLADIGKTGDYDKVMKRLIETETLYAPRFDFDQTPADLQELTKVASWPRGPKRSQWLNDFAARSWSVPDGEAEVCA